MALSSWQSLSASASSVRRLSSSDLISPVSCKRRFSASGWALSEAWASNLSPRAEALEESSLSKAWWETRRVRKSYHHADNKTIPFNHDYKTYLVAFTGPLGLVNVV